MIAIDTNILVYAHRKDSPWHEAAKKVVLDLANSDAPWAIPWPCYHEFLSVATHPKIYQPPSTIQTGLAYLEDLRGSTSLRSLAEETGYFEKMAALALKGKLKGPKIHDCRIAAICLNHGVKRLYSCDRDFSLFPELSCVNPLV